MRWRRRSPCGERGLKLCCLRRGKLQAESLPVRGAWVEIDHSRRERKTSRSRSPCGERGLKFKGACPKTSRHFGRSPCGERGLKYKVYDR